ncbi:MAG: tyrosine-type recombinase/integrase [Phycisphaerae bacterium]|nr:site-specific integrase [Phycisphaerales bacterium]
MRTRVGLSHERDRKKPWVVYWWSSPDPVTGKQKKTSKSFKHRGEAKTFQSKQQVEIGNRGLAESRDVTISELVDEFAKARLGTLSQSSKDRYADTIDQMLEYFGRATFIKDIRQSSAETFMSTRIRRDGRTGELSSWTLSQHLKHARAIFGAAVEWEYIDRNPFVARNRNVRRGKSSLRIKGRSRPWHHLTPSEFKQLLENTPKVRRRALYWLQYGCGLRPGEAYNLRAEDIDLDNQRIQIRNRKPTAETPGFDVKADDTSAESKDRIVPIPDAALKDITKVMALSFKSGGFLVLSEERFQTVQANWKKCRAGKPWSNRTEYRPWMSRDMLPNALRDAKADLKRAGLTLTAPFTMNVFRKSFSQNHANQGTSAKTLAKLLGHSDERMVLRFYSRVTDANEKAAIETMNRLLQSEFHRSSTEAGSGGAA